MLQGYIVLITHNMITIISEMWNCNYVPTVMLWFRNQPAETQSEVHTREYIGLLAKYNDMYTRYIKLSCHAHYPKKNTQ